MLVKTPLVMFTLSSASFQMEMGMNFMKMESRIGVAPQGLSSQRAHTSESLLPRR